MESPERPSLSGGGTGVPPDPLIPPSPAGEGGQRVEVSVFSYFMVLIATLSGLTFVPICS
jgi:hypothetical protein